MKIVHVEDVDYFTAFWAALTYEAIVCHYGYSSALIPVNIVRA
jgi:hypothetical protein